MHNAPAVSFPVGRSRFQAGFIALFWLVAVAVQVVWASQLARSDWRIWVGAVVVLAVGVLAAREWWKSPQGRIRWDGKFWTFELAQIGLKAAEPATAEVSPVLDFQWVMLLLLRFESGRAIWCWLDRPAKVESWMALRRAVFARKPATSRQKPGGELTGDEGRA
jgi:toxin CptA